jgi:hypothetical protein
MGRMFLPANFCDYFLISPTTTPEGKSSFFATTSKVRRQKVLAYEVFVNQQQHQFGRGKKGFGLASCLVQIKLPEHFWREGGGEGRRGGEEKKPSSYKFATVIQIQTLDKHIHPIMLRLFVTIGTFFILFIQQLEKLHQFKFYFRAFLIFNVKFFSEDLHFILKLFVSEYY